MISARCVPFALVLLVSVLVPAFAFAQASPAPVPPAGAVPLGLDVQVHDARQGSLAAEVSLGILGDIVGMVVSFAATFPTVDVSDDGEDDSEASMYRAIGVSLIARPLMVGGFTALGGYVSHGEGRASISVLGAVPGTLMLGAGWLMMSGDHEEPAAATLALGHLVTIAGSVAAYRYSARLRVSERMARALRYAPSPMVDRQRGVAGLSLSGSF